MKTKNQKLLEEVNEAFAQTLKEMEADEPMELTIHHIIPTASRPR